MERDKELEEIICDLAGEKAAFAIAYALLRLAEAQDRTAYWLKCLGNGDAATPMGAIEAYGMHIGERMDSLARAINTGLESLATAINDLPMNDK